MNDISHKQAVRLIHLRLDGLLNESRRHALDEHLVSCDSCRDYATEMDALPARLQNEFQVRWDRNAGPSYRVFEHVTTRARKIPMTNRIFAGIRLMASGFFVALLILGINFMVLQMKNNPIDTNETQSVSGSELGDSRLIAFTSEKDGNFDIYTMRADGSNLTNLTNNDALDFNPAWSPDGKRIAFESNPAVFTQIYLMDTDGSNVTQLTFDEIEHEMTMNYAHSNPWSPNGNHLLFFQRSYGGKESAPELAELYSIDINGGNKIMLASGNISLFNVSWSPDGRRIAFIADDPQNLGGDRIFVVNADGSNLKEITKSLQPNEQLSGSDYYWSPDGQSIFFIAFFQKTNPYWTAYEARLADNSLIQHATTNSALYHWQKDISTIGVFSNGSPIKWSRSDETNSTLYPYENCRLKDDVLSGSYLKRSPNGNWAINAYCPNGDFWFYYANSDGTTIQQLLNSPISAKGSNLMNILWSPDDKFIAFNMASSDTSDLYILNAAKALKDPSIQPVKMTNSYGASWQPILNDEVAIKEPTPEPTAIVESNEFPPIGTNKGNGEWIAFLPFYNEIYSPEDMKMDVHMIHPDGSGLTNLTNSPDHYFWLEWSPNGNDLLFLRSSDMAGSIDIMRKIEPIGFEVLVHTGMSRDVPFLYRWSPNSEQIAYVDNLAGNSDIYTIYADGRNDTQPKQLTNDSGQEIDLAWSPDGSQIAYQRTNGEQLSIIVMDVDGSNQHEVARGMGKVRLYWSVNGNSVYASSTENNWLECDGCVQSPAIYQIDLNGPPVRQLYYETDADQFAGWYLYDTPQGILYFIHTDRPDFVELWGTWFRADGNSVTEIGKLDPQQTCKTATGNVLNESFSPNSRFSVVSNFCDGGFDLFLADREAISEERFIHLLQLPLDTLGQGGDFATLPIVWSPDGRWIAYDNGNAAVYLLNIEGVRQDPVTEPLLLWQSENDLITFLEIAWQPVSNPEVVDEEPTPEPTQTSSSDSLIAFTADNNDSTNTNTDIYTIRHDGSNLTNLTHGAAEDFNANDFNPAWSPDRKKIAFMSDRRGNTTGNTNIFVMNPDGSGLSQLTYNPGYDAFLSWSPNGEQIIYFSSPIAESNAKGQLIVMNADGSDKTILTTLGYYYFRSWSPDNQKIVYVQPRFNGESYRDAGIHVVDIDGKNRREWFADRINQIHWEDSEHFLGVIQTGEDTQAIWTLYQFNTDGSQIELATHRAPIVAIFERTYVVDGQDGLMWFALEGAPISLSPWNVAEKCETTGDSYVSTSLSMAPDQKRALVIIYCKDATWHYLVNEDGSEINQLGAPIDSSVAILPHWSPDGQYVSLFVIDYGDDLYLLDIQKMLNDPSATPILLATNVLAGVVYGEPLIASKDDEEKQTPEPPVFSLSVNAAEKLAFFDVLEPSYLPVGYALEGVAYNPWTQQVAMKYISQQGNGSILIYQQRGDLLHYPDLRASTTPVPIGDMDGEFIQGAWIYESPDTTIPTWDPSADSYSLTWQNGEFVFSINFVGGETITPLSLNELVAMAESLK